MSLNDNKIIMDKEQIKRALFRISHEVLEKNKGTKNLAIIGIRNKGAYLAARMADYIKEIDSKAVPVGILDITLYRDDLTTIAWQPVVRKTEIDFDITGKNIILVDDVLFTGRTIRCALDALIDFGRPKNIQLAILIDRGHRELPIRADYVGKNVPTSLNETVDVSLIGADAVDKVSVRKVGKQ
ncbi:MAG: bifunctional pyr operon transcriptional regulator/uracil phosphoribosyltransferase PyrR [Candidatus Omnitrophica bacterium]|nr:bifunctional pyr operon transcriptional regulator/uracil phosphoribosyltransferase PyrR [Candidatus Omnitrophota bacterium]